MPVDVAGDVERGELVADFRELRPHLGGFALQQADGLFGQDVSVNVDRLHRLGDHGSAAARGLRKDAGEVRERNASRRADRVADGVRIVIGCARLNPGGTGMLDQPAASHRARLRDRPRLDFQDHLADLEANGLLVRIDRPINKDTELHPLVRWQFLGGVPEDKRRAFLFTHVTDSKGRRYDIPVVVGALAASPDIYAMGMGQEVKDIGEAWMRAIANPIAPIAVSAPRCQEVVLTGDDLKAPGGLARLPVPVSTPGFDSAPYLTATLCVTRDPDSGIQNMGTYRAALKAADRLVVRMVAREASGAGGYLHWLKYRKRREPMPIAIVIGCAPVVMFTGPQKLAIDMDELGVAGALAGAPIEIAKSATIDLDVLEPEAPFGESNGYVALEAYNMPMRVTAVTHKRAPVFTSIISQVTPSESSVVKKVAYEPLFLSHLRDRLGIKGVRRVVMHERLTNLRPVIFLQLAEGTPRSEVWRALHGAATLQSNCGKIVIAVSEDIDPASMDAVLWSLALPTREYMEHARALWEELDLYPLNVQSPWHGYGLGDWTDRWETFARRAATGDWELTGNETLARQRGGLTPETPARFDDKPKKPSD